MSTLDVTGHATSTCIRRRDGQGRCVVPPADGLERRRGPCSGEACQALLLTAKARLIAPLTVLRRGARRLPPPHRAVARRTCRGRARPVPLRCQVRDRGRGARVDDRPRRRPARGGADPDAGLRVPAFELSTPTDVRRATPTTRPSSSGCGSSPAHRPGGASSTTACCRPRPGSRSTRSASRRAATRARSPLPASTTAAIPIAACAFSSSTATSCRPTTPSSASTARPSAGSRAPSHDGDGVLALAYVRREVPDDAVLSHGSRSATQLHSPSPRP